MTDLPSQSEPLSPAPSRRDKIIKGVFVGIIAIALLTALVPIGAMVLFWTAMSAEEELRLVSSPGDRHQLQVNYTAAWIYSPHGIVLRVKQGNKTLATYATQLANDGANLGDRNAQVIWESDTVAHICLKGHEQAPAGIQMTIDPPREGGGGAIFTENPDSCL